jgi:hypothetical protein
MSKPDPDEEALANMKPGYESTKSTGSTYQSFKQTVRRPLQQLRRNLSSSKLGEGLSPKGKVPNQKSQRRVSPSEEDLEDGIGRNKQRQKKSIDRDHESIRTSKAQDKRDAKARLAAEMSGGGKNRNSKGDKKADLWGSFKEVARNPIRKFTLSKYRPSGDSSMSTSSPQSQTSVTSSSNGAGVATAPIPQRRHSAPNTVNHLIQPPRMPGIEPRPPADFDGPRKKPPAGKAIRQPVEKTREAPFSRHMSA